MTPGVRGDEPGIGLMLCQRFSGSGPIPAHRRGNHPHSRRRGHARRSILTTMAIGIVRSFQGCLHRRTSSPPQRVRGRHRPPCRSQPGPPPTSSRRFRPIRPTGESESGRQTEDSIYRWVDPGWTPVKQWEDLRRIVDTAPALFEGGVKGGCSAYLAGNVVGRGAPWGHVQSAAGPFFGAGP